MIKVAYKLGVLRALREAGIKVASDDANLSDGTENQQNPAEQLAALFQQGASKPPVVAPDNKTKIDVPPGNEKEPHWGKEQHGSTGAEGALNATQDFHMPGISAI